MGLLTETRRDELTDMLARGDAKEVALETEWAAKVTAELRTVTSKAARKYLYGLVRSSDPALDDRGRALPGKTVGFEAQDALGDCLINRVGSYHTRDAYIPLLTAAQVRRTAAKGFNGVKDLMALKWSVARLTESAVEIKFPKPGTADVARVYGDKRSRAELDYTCLVATVDLKLGSDGAYTLPARLFRDEREEDEDWDP